MPRLSNTRKNPSIPNVNHDGIDRFIQGIVNGTTIGFKYFDMQGKRLLIITMRGTAVRKMRILAGTQSTGEITVTPSEKWTNASTIIEFTGITALNFYYSGNGKCDYLNFKMDILQE